MKKSNFLIVLMAIIVLASCSDEAVVLNQSIIRDQLAQLSVPSAQEINVKLSSPSSSLKKVVGVDEVISQRVLQIDKEYFEVTETYATRYLRLYQIASSGRIKREIEVQQRFTIKDGVLDTTNWAGRFDLEGVGLRRCYLGFSDQITSMTVFFHRNDGLQLAYRGNLYDNALYLPPLANGKWQVQVETSNKGLYQTFVTIPQSIQKADSYELLLLYDDVLMFSDPRENTVAVVTVQKNSLQGNYLFVCEDENGNCFSQPIPATISSETISFAIPFKPKNIYIWGWNGWETEIGPGVEPGVDGIYRYNL